jgi:hypothetical protein
MVLLIALMGWSQAAEELSMIVITSPRAQEAIVWKPSDPAKPV